MRDRPWAVLTRHFFASLFDLGFLSDAGAEPLTRVMLGCLAVAIGGSLVMVKLFVIKYANITAARYDSALLADHAFLIGLLMWVAAAALVLVGHALFPDDVDYRILMAEPLSRATVFGAKLTALLLFAALVVGGGQTALLFPFLITLGRQPGFWSGAAYGAAFAVSSVAASLCAALLIVAVHGLLVLFAPRARLLTFASIVRSAMIAGLLLGLPFVMRLSGAARAVSTDAWWIRWAPPFWFVGLERWLLGDPSYRVLALVAIVVTLASLAVVSASYVVLYRRFDRLSLRPTASHVPRTFPRLLPRRDRRPVRTAVRAFISITLARSVLHQGVTVALIAAAMAYAMNWLVGSALQALSAPVVGAVPFLDTLLWAPMVLILLIVPAVRLSLSLPIDLRSNWVFRVTEHDGTREEVGAAAVRTVFGLGVALPVALIAPLQWWLLGGRAFGVIVVEALIGWLFVECLMRRWRRVPFTCSYIPGKGFVPYMLARGIAVYAFFTWLAGAFLHVSAMSGRAAAALSVVLGVAAILFAAQRRRAARRSSLTFEDELPSDVVLIGLGAD